MRLRRNKLGIGVLLAGILSLLIWQFVPLQAINSIASLSDPAKLATLGKRGANPRLNKVVYWLNDASQHGWSPESTLYFSFMINGTGKARADLTREELIRNLNIASQLGLLTRENLERLKNGHAAEVTIGPYKGESVEIDHIVPVSVAPEVGNELANLEMLPRTLNRKKSDKVGDRQISHAQSLFKAGLLKKESLDLLVSRRQ